MVQDASRLNLLVSAQLSPLFPASQATNVLVETRRRDLPLAPTSSIDTPPEHASCTSILHHELTGTIALRVIQAGTVLELVSLSAQVAPLRLLLPSPVLDSPGIALWESELHIIAVTECGSLFRVVLPVANELEPWKDQTPLVWSREHVMQNIGETVKGLVHVHGVECVVIGTPNGSLLRLDLQSMGSEASDDIWTESIVSAHKSMFHLPSFLAPSNVGDHEFVSIATHPWPTDNGNVWTISRDRTLRLWVPGLGCKATKVLPSNALGGSEIATPTSNTPPPKVLLEPSPQRLLRVFTPLAEPDMSYLASFLPTPNSQISGGIFHFFDVTGEDFTSLLSIQTSRRSVGCHLQDFIILGSTLYVLWDRHGKSEVESLSVPGDVLQGEIPIALDWKTAAYAEEEELTPARLEELLRAPGAMADHFLTAILRPGTFSACTLRSAIERYVDACLSLPGITVPPALTSTYGTIGEHIAAVVGCTVTLERDPSTGAVFYDRYWIALKRDWEGFIARCRDIERRARWPLALGAQTDGTVIIVERERVGTIVKDDLPIQLWKSMSRDSPTNNALLDVCATLRRSLGVEKMLQLEAWMNFTLHSELAFPFPDVIAEQVRQTDLLQNIDDGLSSWLDGRLASIEDKEAAVGVVLDFICEVADVVKAEPAQDESFVLPSKQPGSEWQRSLAAHYTNITLDARYELCLSLVAFFHYIAEQLSGWKPSLISEVFGLFRGLAMLRYVGQVPYSDSNKPPVEETSAADDVVSLMRNMQVSQTQYPHVSAPSYSLIHRLLAQHDQPSDLFSIPTASHKFLDISGILRTDSPSVATSHEVLLCEKLRLLGHYDACRELLAWLPRTAAAQYVQARLWLNVGRVKATADVLDKLAGCFDTPYALGDRPYALAQLLPGNQLFETTFEYYLHVAMLFKANAHTAQEVLFTQRALSVAPEGTDTSALWQVVIRGYADLTQYEDAYSAWASAPFKDLKRDSLNQLVYRMCEDDAVEKLLSFNFAGFTDAVEAALSFKTRNADPRAQPDYSRILYSWFTFRGDYKNAALVMYQRAQRLHTIIGKSSAGLNELAQDEAEAYMIAINALSLTNPSDAWIVVPRTSAAQDEQFSKRKLSKYIPASKFTPGKQGTDLVRLADIQYDYALLVAQIEAVKLDPSLLQAAEFALPPESIVIRLTQANRFEAALSTAKSLKVDMTEIFTHLTYQCMKLERDPDAAIEETWVLTESTSTWVGTSAADRAWRFLRRSLEVYDGKEMDWSYSKVVYEVLVTNQIERPPAWLVTVLQVEHPEYLIRTSLRYSMFDLAVDYAIDMITRSSASLDRTSPPSISFISWLPYTLIDQVLQALPSLELQQRLRDVVDTRLQKVSSTKTVWKGHTPANTAP